MGNTPSCSKRAMMPPPQPPQPNSFQEWTEQYCPYKNLKKENSFEQWYQTSMQARLSPNGYQTSLQSYKQVPNVELPPNHRET